MPSANQSGGAIATSVAKPAPARPRDQTSYWNWCTISCISTCSKSEYEPVNGMTARLRAKSVTPPVPSPPTWVALVCMKSECDAYRMIGFRSRNSWFSTLESRAYERSAIRAASIAATRSRS